MTSADSATAAGESAGSAPSSANRSTDSGDRLWATTSYPASRTFSAIGSPMIPVPINPIVCCVIGRVSVLWALYIWVAVPNVVVQSLDSTTLCGHCFSPITRLRPMRCHGTHSRLIPASLLGNHYHRHHHRALIRQSSLARQSVNSLRSRSTRQSLTRAPWNHAISRPDYPEPLRFERTRIVARRPASRRRSTTP